ncbi:MAG TPA: type II secretion system protein N [Gammaproteobacteria bacterium]
MSPAIKSAIKYSAFGGIAYLVFLLSTMPAAFAYGYWKTMFGGDEVPLTVSDLSGSVWSGQAAKATLNGRQLNALTWDINSLSLLLGIVEMNFEFKVTDGYGKGVMGFGIFGGAYLNNVEAWLPLSEIEGLIKAAVFKPGGALDIKLSNVKLDNNTLVSAKGDIAWHGAELTVLKKLVLGDLDVALEPHEGGVRGVLSDQGGPLTAEGVLQLSADRSYEFTGAFGTRGTNPDLQNALRTMGRAERDGKIKVSLKGNLEQFGL